MAVDNPESFYLEARYQGACAQTGGLGPWQAHHVVYKEHLKREGWPLYDTRNALRLLTDIHLTGQTNHMSPVQTVNLTDDNIEFAVECMGPGATVEYLRRYYDDDTEPDPRLIELEHEWEAERVA